MERARHVLARTPLRQPSQRIRDRSPTYGIAIEAYTTAIDLGCDDRIASALWDIAQREADIYASKIGEGR